MTLADLSSKFLDLRILSNNYLSRREFLDTDLWLGSFWKLCERLDNPFFPFEGQNRVVCVTGFLLKLLGSTIIV